MGLLIPWTRAIHRDWDTEEFHPASLPALVGRSKHFGICYLMGYWRWDLIMALELVRGPLLTREEKRRLEQERMYMLLARMVEVMAKDGEDSCS